MRCTHDYYGTDSDLYMEDGMGVDPVLRAPYSCRDL